MTHSGDLQHSLAAMGFVELALAFSALGFYSLILNGSLEGKGRLVAAACAAAGAFGFVAMTDPWVNGVILIVLGVAGIGLFVAAVWAVSAACGLTSRRVAAVGAFGADSALPEAVTVVVDSRFPDAAPSAARPRPRTPAHPA